MYGDVHEEQMADTDIRAIHQFLVDHNFDSTAESLIKEASKMGFQNLQCKLGTITDLYAQLMFCYHTGNYLTFFQLWNVLFPESIKQCEEYKKLTFYLHVHFAVLPKRKLYAHQNKEYEPTSRTGEWNSSSIEKDPILQNCKENNANEIEKRINNSMKQLQDYLSGDGKELKHDTELQPFYALPFIEDFYADTLYANILEECWLDELTRNLNSFITNYRQNLIDMNNTEVDKTQSQDSVRIFTTKATAAESDVVLNKIRKNNVPIVPNDRDIPIFLEDDHNDEEQYGFSHETNRSLKSKSTQTRITGDQIAINNSRGDALNPGESVRSLLRLQKTDRRLMQCNQELALTKTHLCSVHMNYEKLKGRFHKLHADYHKLIDVAGELTVALENSVKGQAVDIQRTLEICMKIFPDLFNQNIRETSYPSLLQFAHTDVKAIALPKLDIKAVPIPPKLLDYRKIKLHLLNGDVKTKLLLLQALRWKITLAQSTEQDEVLHEFISRDLLGLHGQIASDNGKPVLPSLLTAGEAYARHLLQQFTARLLNALASFRCGRDYLSVGSTVVNVTFACLDNNYVDGVDPFGCDMMLAMLQKLSLRRQQRIYMIESGLLEWLINHLHDKYRVMNLYRLEYATALLMNLSLHRLAQARASKIAPLLVSTLLILLSLDHASSLPYINGALNNFLNNPVISEEAKRTKHMNVSDFAGNKKTAEIRKHLDHVLKIQKREIINTPQNDETGDDDNEELDVLENEVDENDPLQNYVGELNGETLLAMCYSVSSKVPQDAINTDTILQTISATNLNEFCDTGHNNHVHSKHTSYPALRYRYNVKMKNKMLPKKSCTKQAAFAKQILNLSNSSFKGIPRNGTSKRFSVDKVQSIARQSIDTESSFIMKYESGVDGSQNKSFAILDDIWTSNTTMDHNNRYKFNDDNHVKTKINSRNNRLKLHASENRVDTSKFHDGKFRRKEKLEKLSSTTVKSFKQNLSERMASNDTIYLYENQISKDSSETIAASSMTLASVRENSQTETEKFSSVASLYTSNYDSNVVNDTTWKNDSELVKEEAEAFLAKPKLSRTPP